MQSRFKRNVRNTPLDDLIAEVLLQMQQAGPGSPEYPKMMTYLGRLYEIKAKNRRAPVSRDTVALIAGNLMGIVLIVVYEQKHVMTSKAFTYINRPK